MKWDDKSFGTIIAFLLPGFALLFGLSFIDTSVDAWLTKYSLKDGPTIGGVLFSTLASLSIGLLVSAVRWLLFEFRPVLLRLKRPELDFSKLDKDKHEVFLGIVANHYRYHQYHGNMLVVVLVLFTRHLMVSGWSWNWLLCLTPLAAILFLASRDALEKYYERSKKLTG